MIKDGRSCKNKSVGVYGEELAVKFLKAQKYKIIERNFQSKCGEIDIVAIDSNMLVFVEVKTRNNYSFGPPQLSVTQFKQRQISKAALTYVASKNLYEMDARFDVVAIVLRDGGKPLIDLIKNAFDLTY